VPKAFRKNALAVNQAGCSATEILWLQLHELAKGCRTFAAMAPLTPINATWTG